jgi:hypothetical protein
VHIFSVRPLIDKIVRVDLDQTKFSLAHWKRKAVDSAGEKRLAGFYFCDNERIRPLLRMDIRALIRIIDHATIPAVAK